MPTLIIPDLHNHAQNAGHSLRTERFDRVVFLWDFFDDFGDNVSDATLTAIWLRRLIKKRASEEAVSVAALLRAPRADRGTPPEPD